MLEFILKIFVIAGCIGTAICMYMLFKNNNTYKMHIKIIDAIYTYKIECIKGNKVPMVDYTDMKSYDLTLHRFWDWGCENILPKEKYEIIKPYIC